MRAVYENVKDQIGRCGIWCGSCALGNGSLRALIDGLEAVLDSHGAQHWAPSGMDYAAFTRGLDDLSGAAACVGCRRGGGRDSCALRACSTGRSLGDCADCPELGACANDDLLRTMRDGARKAGLFVREPGEDRTERLASWGDRLRTTWPSRILFEEER